MNKYKKLIRALQCNGYGIAEEADGLGCANKKCKYRDADGACDLISMTLEAVAAIAALQAENAELKQRVEAKEAILKLYEPTLSLVSGDKDTAIHRMRKAEAALSRVEAERDAAISDVPHDCEHCKHAMRSGACKLLPEGDQFSPDYTESFDRDGNCDHWEWRGAQGEG